MTPLCAAVVAALAVQSPAADSLRQLALRLPQTALVTEARAHPLTLREAFSEAITQSVKAPEAAVRVQQLSAAQRLAAAHAEAWRDSFLIRQVARFAGWPPERRAARVWADSVRLVGVGAYSRDGPRAAIAIWRRGLARARAIGDTAGMAAVLGNIGSAFFAEGRLDSAARYLERARRLAAAIGDVRVEGNAVGTLAGLSEEHGDLAAARERYGQALGLRERIGDSRGMAADQNNLGLLAQSAGDLEEARRRFEAALAINRRDGREAQVATNLVNLAGLASLNGDFADADSLYRGALATWRRLESWTDAGVALHGLGLLEMRRGDYPAAQSALREALGIYERTGLLSDALAVRRELAAAQAAAGELQEAVDNLRQARYVADSAGVRSGVRAGIALAQADLAVQLNTLAEAERLYNQAARLFAQAADPTGAGEARQGLGMLLMARDDYVGADQTLRAALGVQVAAGNRRGAALTRLSLAQVAQARGDTAASRRQLARAAAELDRLGDPVAAAAALAALAALKADAGLPVAAESLYRAGLARLQGRVAPEVAWRLDYGLALALRAQGRSDDAARELRAALAEVERPSWTLALPERRSAFLADKGVVYAQLALLERARGRPGAAFEASEQVRAREMQELLARGRVPAFSDTAADLVTREQDLRRRIAELTAALESGSSGALSRRGPDIPLTGAAHEALLRAQYDYAAVLLEMRERAPRHATLVAGRTPTWRDVARRLAPEQALVEYLLSDSSSLAFVVVSDTMAVLDLGVRRQELARLIELARGTLEPSSSLRPDSLWRAPLRRLYADLIVPVRETGLLAGRSQLLLVPHAELHYLPFAALLDQDGHYLIERYEVAETPSAAVWLALGERDPTGPGSGVLALAPRADALPGSRREVEAIRRLAGPDVEAPTGDAATEAAFRREAPSRRILHLATFGVLNKQNPMFSYVELAPGGGQDGRLEVHEVFGLRLAADLVVLSACQTGLGSGRLADVPAGDDWVGLTRAFLHAGAARVVATLWAVEDRPSASLMERFYAALATGAAPERALALAQRTLLSEPASAHPFNWAGFVVVGGAQ